MKKKKKGLSSVFSGLHIIFWLSLCFFGTVYLSFGILLIPALCSLFGMGKELLTREFDITDNIFKRFFSGIGESISMMRYFPFILIIALEAVGMTAAARTGLTAIAYICPAMIGLILTFLIYLCLYRTHLNEKTDIIGTFMIMVVSLPHMITIWLAMTLCVIFFGSVFMVISALAGALVMLLIQGVGAVDILNFKSRTAELTEDEKKLIGRFVK